PARERCPCTHGLKRESGASESSIPELPRSGNRERPSPFALGSIRAWEAASSRQAIARSSARKSEDLPSPLRVLRIGTAMTGCRALVGGADGTQARAPCSRRIRAYLERRSDSARGSGKPRSD